MDKEFGKLSRQQFREFYAHYYGSGLDKIEVFNLFKERNEQLTKVLSITGSWGCLYDLPAAEITLLFFHTSGLLPLIVEACQSDDPEQGLLDFLESDIEPERLSEENEALALITFMAMAGNFEAIGAFGQSISELVDCVSKGDDDALFNAVIMDRTVLVAEPIACRIALAQMMDDNSFMDRLAKAITKTKPSRPKIELDDTRFLLDLLENVAGLDNLSNKIVDELIADDLQAIPGGNSYDRISKLLTEFRNKYRK
jgi:hypothetical protein